MLKKRHDGEIAKNNNYEFTNNIPDLTDLQDPSGLFVFSATKVSAA